MESSDGVVRIGWFEYPAEVEQFTLDADPNYYEKMLQKGDAFNGDAACESYMEHLIRTEGIGRVVETGTFCGHTLRFFARHVPEVHSVENSHELYGALIRRDEFSPSRGVHLHYGSSADVLPLLLPNLDASVPTMFYLDAHWGAKWPLLDELACIENSGFRNNCVVVIDDVRVPGRNDIPFDSYAGQDLDWEYVEQHMRRIFTKTPEVSYYTPPNGKEACRARLVVLPRPESLRPPTSGNPQPSVCASE